MKSRLAAVVMVVSVAVATMGLLPSSAHQAPAKDTPSTKARGVNGLRNEGVGQYTDPSVANQISAFTINRHIVTCAVGTFGAPGLSGPFSMLMYSTKLRTYKVKDNGSIVAKGRMRSITEMGDEEVEDVKHPFIAIARDSGGETEGDKFNVHFATPFWNQESNPMCTPSSIVEGGCRFGGGLVVGDVVAR